MKKTDIRLNKYLTDAGICSRRQADRLIEEKAVTVNGKPAALGQKISGKEHVCVNGKPVHSQQKQVILLFNKPKGIVCTEDRRERNNVIRYLNYPTRITYAGRLDKDSEGLMIMTNDGNLINRIMRARNHHEKEYKVRVNRPITKEFLKGMSEGVPIEELNTTTRPCTVSQIGKYTFQIVLTQGLNRQIRRMCEHFGYQVMELRRTRILNLKLADLPSGKTRLITTAEYADLCKLLEQEQTNGTNERANPSTE